MQPILILIFLSCLARTSFAAEASLLNSFWLTGSQESVRETTANSNNAVLKLPDNQGRFDWRPELKIDESRTKIVIRPEWYVTNQKVTANGVTSYSTDYKWQWLDAYMAFQLSDRLAATYGLQNYQWGPAEATSPSNPIFRETAQDRDLLYSTVGRHLLRFNLTPTQQWSFVAMAELSESGAPPNVVDEKFEPTALLKSEYSWGGGARYVGLVVGGKRNGEMFFGEYANFEVFEDFTLYFDVSHESGSHAWYPVKNASTGLISMSQDRLRSGQTMTFSVAGARYNFQRGTDVRAELVWQEAGYNNDQMGYRWQMMSSQNPNQLAILATQANRLARNGLEFAGQQYALLSVREPNFFSVKDWSIYLRGLSSLRDKSAALYLASESALGQHGTLYASVGAGVGADDSELRSFANWNALAGVKFSW